MIRAPLRWCSGVLWLVLGLLCGSARADTPVQLFKSFAGYVNFTGTVATMRTGTTNVCQVIASTTTISKSLSGIPAGANILSAHLYWSGSGTTPDTSVTFEGQTVISQRNYTAAYTTGGVTYDYFSGAADVTSIVKAKGNGTYSFSGLTVNAGSPWCAVEGVLGGFALLVVYEDPASQPFRVLNIYEGFQYTRDSTLTLNLSNFRVPNPIGSASGRIGHITWEGDSSLQAQGEDLTFNGQTMTDSMNPAGNQFNSASNINGDQFSYGIDFDAYTINSPPLQPDQTTATTVYSSGQDLVLLNAEIVAVPNVPTDDLALTMSRSGQAVPGQNVAYTLTVQNNGPNDELGPITVTDTLPSGMTYVSASGTGWACSASGQVVTCTRSGTLARNVAASTITLTAAVSYTATGTYTNSATVAGKIFDNVSSNNTGTDTASDPTILQGAGMILTDRACTSGVDVSTDPTDNGCHRITWLYANSQKQVWLTVLDATGKPKAPKANGNFAYTPKFALSCVNPTTAGTTAAGVNPTATMGGTALRVCLANGATPGVNATNTWSSTLNLPFSGGAASVGPVIFQYPDVGLVQLNFTDATTTTTVRTARFVSVPAQLSIAVKRPDGALPSSAYGFVRAGEAFTVSVTALMSTVTGVAAQPAPNFGRETPAVGLKLGQSALPFVVGSFASQGNGTISGNFTYNEVGEVTFTALMAGPLNDYLGSGVPVGYDPNASPAQSPPTGQSILVGRFYPAYFSTETTSNFGCLTRMKCPTGNLAHGESLVVSGATYSRQPFTVTVTPRAVDGTALKNYAGIYGADITLKPVAQPGATGAASGTLYLAANDSTAVTIPAATQGQAGLPLTASTYFKLSTAYTSTTPQAAWSAPQAVYFNAQAPQTRVTSANAVGTDTVNSNRTAAAISSEGGIEVVNGRLQVANAYGSELLRLPVQIGAQYWSGTAWEYNTGDSASLVDATKTVFVTCKTITCNATAVLSGSLKLVTGVNTVWLKAPGVGGNTLIEMGGAPAWLPSTRGQIVFGVYKSKLIYLREVY